MGWGERGIPLVQSLPEMIPKISLCAAIDNKGVVAY